MIEFHQNTQWEMVELDSGLNVRDNRFVRTQQDVDNGAVCSICDVKVSLNVLCDHNFHPNADLDYITLRMCQWLALDHVLCMALKDSVMCIVAVLL